MLIKSFSMHRLPFTFSSLLELAARIYVWGMISIYGAGKMIGGQFHRRGFMPDEVAQMAIGEIDGFNLAWTFFGYSSVYIYFIGISQLVGGALLLFNRTKLLGVAILIPILANIILVDIVFEIPTGALFNAIVYLSMLGLILYLNREQVMASLAAMLHPAKEEIPNIKLRLVKIVLAGLIVIGLFTLQTLSMKYTGS